MKDAIVTVFGGGGFIGRYTVQELLAGGEGYRVRIAQRDPKGAWYLKPLGALGQTQFIAADIRNRASVERAVAGASAVVNLVGVLKGDFQGFHVDGARNVAEAAAAAGAQSLVHISAIGADSKSPSRYGRSKALGEAAVRQAFPGATILRPSIVFGREDGFTNRFAAMLGLPVVPVVRGSTRFQPVFVADLAQSIAAAVAVPLGHAGKTYEIGGPEKISMIDLLRRLADWTGRKPHFIDLPDGMAAAMARATGWAPGAPITWDQWQMLQRDNVVADGAEGLEAFGISPTPLAAVAPGWLIRYRRQGRFGGVKTVES
jgi:uncharacterized protein YbjT (DUF2867 family)